MSFISERDQGFLCKIIVVGNQGVGKSSLLLQYTQQDFKPDYNVTIGVEFASKLIYVENQKAPLTLQIWDTAGQESFKSIVRTFYQQAAAAFLVYNITNRQTFEALDEWIKEIREYAHQDIVLVIVGNQLDNQEQREVSYEEGIQYLKNNKCDIFYETSAKTAQNVNEVFEEVAKQVFQKFIQNQSFKGSFQSEENYLNTSVDKQQQPEEPQFLIQQNNNGNIKLQNQNSQEKNISKQVQKSGCC